MALFLIALVIFICYTWYPTYFGEITKFTSGIEAITLLGLLLFAVFELEKDKRNNLEKRLTVIFQYEGKPVMVCEDAYLSGKSDIRAWGQQLGLQMSGLRTERGSKGMDLAFEPLIRLTKEEGELKIINKKQYMHYQAIFTLRNIAWVLEDELAEGKFIHWICKEEETLRLTSPIAEYEKVYQSPQLFSYKHQTIVADTLQQIQ